MTINKYRIFCITEQDYKYVWGDTPPTTCPTNTAHEVNLESVAIVDRVDDNVLQTEPANNFSMQTDGAGFTFSKGATSSGDFKIENHAGESYTTKYLRGADWKVIGAVDGDWAEFSVIDIDDVLGYGANTVLKTYVRKKYINNNTVTFCEAMAPGAIPVGVYLRCTYHSTGSETDPKMYINYHIETKE